MSDNREGAGPAPKAPTTTERGPMSVRHLQGASSAARKVAGARRNPSVVGYDDSIPLWLRAVAGWSWRLLVIVAAVAIVFYSMFQVQLVFIAVFLALVMTSILRPVTDFYDRVMPRGLATALAILTALLIIAGLLTYVITSVVGQWQKLAAQFNVGVDQIFTFVQNSPLPVDVKAGNLNDWLDEGRKWLNDHSGDIATQAAASAGSIFEGFAGVALAIFCTVFFLLRGREMWIWFLNQLPARNRESWKTAGGAGWYTFSGYARGTVIIALTDGILVGIFLSILGVPLAVPLAVLVFIGAFIPIIGAPLAMVIAAVVALAADGVVTALIVVVGIAAIGQFEGHVLQPLVMGKQVSLHPMVVALAVTTGTLLAGILGAIVSVPMVAVTWTVFSKLRHHDPPMDEDLPPAQEIALSTMDPPLGTPGAVTPGASPRAPLDATSPDGGGEPSSE